MIVSRTARGGLWLAVAVPDPTFASAQRVFSIFEGAPPTSRCDELATGRGAEADHPAAGAPTTGLAPGLGWGRATTPEGRAQHPENATNAFLHSIPPRRLTGKELCAEILPFFDRAAPRPGRCVDRVDRPASPAPARSRRPAASWPPFTSQPFSPRSEADAGRFSCPRQKPLAAITPCAGHTTQWRSYVTNGVGFTMLHRNGALQTHTSASG